MNKRRVYTIFIIVFMVMATGIILKYSQDKNKEKVKIYGLIERKGRDSSNKEWKELKEKADNFSAALEADPSDIKAALGLASLFIQEARVSGNYAYYDKATLKTVNDVLAIDSLNFEALVYKSLVYFSQHHFVEGLAIAEKAKNINPYNPYVYGLMVDGNVELGNYDSAIVNSDRMVAIRPDLTSYSRISYLREIHGDYKGAIEAMKLAVEAGGPGDEYTEWSRVQLGALLEKTGDYKNAAVLYQVSLNLRPAYPFAYAGLGRVAIAAKDYKSAIAYYDSANAVIDDHAIKEGLADAYLLAGNTTKANSLFKRIVASLSANASQEKNDENIGHYSDRELAYAYLKINEKDKALEHALMEYNRRPGNIDVNETVAWVFYTKGEYEKALPYLKTALKTNSRNPVLLNRAALIYYKTGRKDLAKSLLAACGEVNEKIDPVLHAETKIVLNN